MRRLRFVAPLLVLVSFFRPAPAAASLTSFQTFVGTVGVSTDGFGSTTQSGQIQASVPAGATVLGAYLYTSTFSTSLAGVGGTLNGTSVTYTSLGTNNVGLTAGRADVTSIVAPVINGGAGGIYNFAVTETSGLQDGEALVVVYSLGSLPTTTVGILDGFSATTGDSASINFSDPLDPTAAGFFAEMFIGDGFSCCGQTSTVTVNGTVITQNAGNNDDSVDAVLSNGNLITVGGFNDPFSSLLPGYADDHERYNLVPFISLGSTSILVDTLNPSTDDNIFLEVFRVAGIGGVNTPPPTVPEPASATLLGLAMSAALARRTRRRK